MYVCVISYLLPRCLEDSGGFLHDQFPSQTEMIGPSRAPLSPCPHYPSNKEEEATKEETKEETKEKTKETKRSPSSRPSRLQKKKGETTFVAVPLALQYLAITFLLRGLPSGADAPYPETP